MNIRLLIGEFLEEKEMQLNTILKDKKLKGNIELKGAFSSSNEEGIVYITITEKALSRECRIEPTTFKTSFLSFELYHESIFQLIDTVIFEEDIQEKIDSLTGEHTTSKFSGLYTLEKVEKEVDAVNTVMTFAEASEIWGLSKSTLNKVVDTGKLQEGKDYRRSKGTWLITRSAMIKLYEKR